MYPQIPYYPSLHFWCCDKTQTNGDLGRKEFIWLRAYIHHRRISVQELRPETEAKTMDKYYLLTHPHGYSACFLIDPRSGNNQEHWTLLYLSLPRKILLQTCHRPVWWGQSPTDTQVSLVCVTLIKSYQHLPTQLSVLQS